MSWGSGSITDKNENLSQKVQNAKDLAELEGIVKGLDVKVSIFGGRSYSRGDLKGTVTQAEITAKLNTLRKKELDPKNPIPKLITANSSISAKVGSIKNIIKKCKHLNNPKIKGLRQPLTTPQRIMRFIFSKYYSRAEEAQKTEENKLNAIKQEYKKK